jgi:GGDEF domain-containing protein
VIVGERLRQGIAAAFARDAVAGRRVSVTCSAGVAERQADMAGADALVRAADQAMYVSKQSGGNRVHRRETGGGTRA